MGVSTRNVDRITFFLGSGLAGVGGVAIALISGTNPTLGTTYIIPAFLVVVAGGVGQLKGTRDRRVGRRRRHRVPDRLDQRQHGAGHHLRARRGLPAGPPTGPVHRPHEGAGMTHQRMSSCSPGSRRRSAAARHRRVARRLRRCWCARPASLNAVPARQPRQVLLLGHRRGRHRPRLGSWRHARHGPGRVLRPRRLRDGHAHEARGRRRRATCPTSWCCTATARCRAWWEPFRSGPFTLVAIVAAAGGRVVRSSATRSSSAG